MASCSALKLSPAGILLLLCVGSADLARPALASSSPLPSREDREPATAGELLLQELVEHDLAEELGLRRGAGMYWRGGNVGDICPSACQICLVVCAATCVLSKVPIACFTNCTVSSSCFGKTVTPLPAAVTA
jgi:hypothetical protein